MDERFKEFLRKISEDRELAGRFQACRTPEEAYAVAAGIDEGMDRETFVSGMEQIRKLIEGSGEISDEDLTRVAAGVDATDALISFSAGASLAATSIGAIAAAI